LVRFVPDVRVRAVFKQRFNNMRPSLGCRESQKVHPLKIYDPNVPAVAYLNRYRRQQVRTGAGYQGKSHPVGIARNDRPNEFVLAVNNRFGAAALSMGWLVVAP